jgi:KDO2-lipid IV(A) lauroyltransferase
VTLKTIVAALREGDPLYLLPDMDFGVKDSLLVPFYGVSAGYEVQVMPAWNGFSSDDLVADTARMDAHLQSYIDTIPDQYFWLHKRFKAPQPGVAEVY